MALTLCYAFMVCHGARQLSAERVLRSLFLILGREVNSKSNGCPLSVIDHDADVQHVGLLLGGIAADHGVPRGLYQALQDLGCHGVSHDVLRGVE